MTNAAEPRLKQIQTRADYPSKATGSGKGSQTRRGSFESKLQESGPQIGRDVNNRKSIISDWRRLASHQGAEREAGRFSNRRGEAKMSGIRG